jgi:hypothetical protein
VRIRTIKPTFWKSETLVTVSKETRLLAIALLNYADDDGFFQANDALVRGECFPFDEDSTSVRRGIEELSRISYIALGTTAEGQRIGRVVNFAEHQRVDRATPSKFKDKTITWDNSSITRRGLDEDSSLEGKGREGKGSRKARETPLPENFQISDRVLKWAAQQGLAGVIELHFEAFVSTCKAKGYAYVDWDEAFMNAVRKNWAKIQAPTQRLAV